VAAWSEMGVVAQRQGQEVVLGWPCYQEQGWLHSGTTAFHSHLARELGRRVAGMWVFGMPMATLAMGLKGEEVVAIA